MKRIEAYRRLADLCEREATTARDPGERRQFAVLSQAIRNWTTEDDPIDPTVPATAPDRASL